MKTQTIKPTRAELIEVEAVKRRDAYVKKQNALKARLKALHAELISYLEISHESLSVDHVGKNTVCISGELEIPNDAKQCVASIVGLESKARSYKSLDEFRAEIKREIAGLAIRPDVVQALLKK